MILISAIGLVFAVYAVSIVAATFLCHYADLSFQFWFQEKMEFSIEMRWWHNLVVFGLMPIWVMILTPFCLVTLACYILTTPREIGAIALAAVTIATLTLLIPVMTALWIGTLVGVVSRVGMYRQLEPA